MIFGKIKNNVGFKGWRSCNFLFAILLAFVISSCNDQGCIEADDFGEYQTQTLEIPANANSTACTYDPAKPISDSDQGSQLKVCFTSGTVSIYDQEGVSWVSERGCVGFLSELIKSLCVSKCVEECNSKVGVTGASAEPAWISTSKKYEGRNGGVNILPNAEISMRAIGSISLGDKFEHPNLFVRGDNFLPQSNKSDWSKIFSDIKAGKVLTLYFSGQINDGSFINGGVTPIGRVGAGNSKDIDERVYNAARRLVAYTIPHPDNYDFDSTKSDEKSGSINIPLLPDNNLWKCEYEGDDLLDSSCSNKSYKEDGYANVDDAVVNRQFPISSAAKTTVLGRYGGMIRWQDDGLVADIYNPFSGVNCQDSSCPGLADVDISQGRIVGDLSSADVSISVTTPSKISFRNLLPHSSCDREIEIIIRTLGDNAVDISSKNISVTEAKWGGDHISLEPDQQLVIKQDDTSYTDQAGKDINCGRALAMKIAKYHDIKIEQSGLISFAILNAAALGNCVVNARIINPEGSHIEIAPGFSADFYEYGDFSIDGDPLNNIPIPTLSSLTIWDNGSINGGSKKVFVRKGQIIRFSPESWNQTWSSAGGIRTCGVGMAMKIEPRPALLCRGYGDDAVANPLCVRRYNGGDLVGCDEIASECTNSDGDSYCPVQDCTKAVTCTDGTKDGNPPFTRTDCTLGSLSDACVFPPQPVGYNAGSCDNCSNKKLESAMRSPFLMQPNMVQCYDLERYKGKVSNIPVSGFQPSHFADEGITKGAFKLRNFNGEYGNFENFEREDKVPENNFGNVVFKLKETVITKNPGRLKIIFLDGDNFLKINEDYDNNSSAGDSYTGLNGFRVGFSSYLDFINGEWLEAIFCAETDDESIKCRSLDVPKPVPDQPPLITLQEPIPGEFKAQSATSFFLDQHGNLLRFKAPSEKDCSGVFVGDLYYCHTEINISAELLRISFKIKDPEPANCYINDPDILCKDNKDFACNGIIIRNNNFRANDCDISSPKTINPAVKNGVSSIDASGTRICEANESDGKTCKREDDVESDDASKVKICAKEFRCVSKYANNNGKYYVTVRVKNELKGVGAGDAKSGKISNVVGSIINPVIEVMDGKREIVDEEDIVKPDGSVEVRGGKDNIKIGQAERIYRLLIDDPRYQAILNMSLIVMLTFYGLTYLMGINEAGISDIISRIIKISIIYLFVGPTGWEWFNKIVVQFFKNGTDYLSFLMASSFEDSPELTSAIGNFDFYDKSILFGSVDKVFNLLFASAVQNKMSALLFASIFGWFYLLMIYYGLVGYTFAVANAVLLYLTAQVFISILFVLGPLFFIFTLFNQTKEMFDKWLSQLIAFSLQQIFLLTTLAFFNMMMYEVIKLALGYKICWDEIWTINIVTRITLMSFWTIASIPSRVSAQADVGNIGNNDGIPSFFSILFIWVVAELMLTFITFMTDLAASIGGGIKASELGKGLADVGSGITKTIGKAAGKAWDKTGAQMVRRMDKALFDSGKIAHAERDKKKQEMAKTLSQQGALSRAGKDGISNYKKKNGAELAKMSKEEQEIALKQAKNEAMIKKGKEMGLDEKQVEKVISNKGLKYIGDNAIGALAKAAYQAGKEGGSLTTAVKDQKISTDFTKKEAKKALKNTDTEGRAAIIDAAKRGRIYVKNSSFDSSGEKSFSSKEYKEAAKQLTDEGEVTSMRTGSGWTRSDVEKKKIRERMKKNRAESKSTPDKMTDVTTMADLAMEQEMQDGTSEFIRDKGVARTILGKRRTFAANVGEAAVKAHKDHAAAFNEERADIVAEETQAMQATASAGLKEAQSSLAAHEKTVSNITSDKEGYVDKTEALGKAMAASHDKKLKKEDRVAARAKVAELEGDKDFNKKKADLKAAYSGISQAKTSIENFTRAGGKVDSEDGGDVDSEGGRVAEDRGNIDSEGGGGVSSEDN